jgi:cellulose synthase/poly-beta-1,6-N-acetylglucosamine synthase-like glycosyltransferase
VEVAFWLAASLVFYAYAGYPALIVLAATLRPRGVARRAGHTPDATVLVVVNDEEAVIAAKLDNLLCLDYPKDRLQIVVVSDGSIDRTDEIVKDYEARGIELMAVPGPRGKAAALNQAVPHARGEMLVLTDARQPLAPDAVRALASYLADPTVGAVSGEMHLVAPSEGGVKGVGLYWNYEKLIRRAESRFDSTVGVTGAFYAVRKELFVPLDPRTILDDVALPMEIAMRGYRVVFAPEARAWTRSPRPPPASIAARCGPWPATTSSCPCGPPCSTRCATGSSGSSSRTRWLASRFPSASSPLPRPASAWRSWEAGSIWASSLCRLSSMPWPRGVACAPSGVSRRCGSFHCPTPS